MSYTMQHVRLTLLPVLLAGALGLTGCPVPENVVTVPPGGKWQLRDAPSGGSFWLHVPSNYTHDRPCPVIVSCHGTPPYDVARHHVETWDDYCEKFGCIVVCPDLVGTDGIFGDGPVDGMLRNERVILSVLSTLSYKYNLDRANIMITGFSGGGFPAYWVGLRNPDVFSVVVAQNCNFNRGNLDRWYPRAAVQTPVMIYYGQNDPATIVSQSRDAIGYLRSRGFQIETYVIPGVGHERRPEIAMNFFRNRWSAPRPTIEPARHPAATDPASSATNPGATHE
jgi:poly(3-hydroxybutyrate) depolymerase